MKNDIINLTLEIPIQYAGMRLDQALHLLIPQYSRAKIQEWIKQQNVQVNHQQYRSRDKVFGGEQVNINAIIPIQGNWQAQAIELDIVYEDESILVLNKPHGIIVHPGAGNPNNTLLNALLYHAPELQKVPRAGIVHRLDKDTSGLLVVAKNLTAHTYLVEQLQQHLVKRHYFAIVEGQIIAGGTIDEPLGRHPKFRTRMAIVNEGKPAVTHYRVKEKFRSHTLLDIILETGRTHQIRVHMAHIIHPIVGDPIYGKGVRIPKEASPELLTCLRSFKRQALHAYCLSLTHPETQEVVTWEAPLPDDFDKLLITLREDDQAFNDKIRRK